MKRAWVRNLWLLFCIAFVAIGFADHCQGQASHADIYANIVGHWVGYDDTVLSGVVKHIPVEIVIREVRHKDEVRMDYTYSKPGEHDFSKITKFMKLLPKRSEMIFRWKGLFEPNETYKASGLDEFARTGLGKFTAIGPAPGSGGETGLFTFELGPDTLSYKWFSQDSTDSSMPVTAFTLHRANLVATKP